jgi:TonB-linked SusC/RagA family outer membrane protein
MTRIFSLFVTFMLIGLLAFSQNRVVTGTVSDEKGNPIESATVSVVGTKIGTRTDQNGVYRLINVAPNALIRVSGVDLTAKDMNSSSNAVVNFSILRKAGTELNTVIVTTALGVRRQAKDLGYATAKVSNAVVNASAPVNIANGLQGKVSGLNISTANNGVFEDVKIQIRGIRSLTGNNSPMLLLDGIPTPLNYLASLNPNDIQDVNILKGAAGAAIYGPDAVNGVIVVTMKKGNTNKTTVTLSRTTQFQQVSFFPKFQNQFGSGGYGVYTGFENWSWGDAFDGSMREVGVKLPNGQTQTLKYSPLLNERKNFFNTGLTNQTDLSFNSKDFYMSLQDVNIKGIVPNDVNRRTGIRVSGSKEITNKLKASYNVNYIQGNSNVFDDNAMDNWNPNGYSSGLMNLIFNTPAQIPITSYKNFETDQYANVNGYYTKYGINPYFAIDNWRQKRKREDIIANVEFNYKVNNWLGLTYRVASTSNSIGTTSTSKGVIPTPFAIAQLSAEIVPGNVFEATSRGSRLSSEVFATMQKEVKNFKFNAILGQSMRQTDARFTSVGASSLVVPLLFNVSNRVGEPTAGSSNDRTRINSYFGSIGLGYKGWANIELLGRNDINSLLAKNATLTGKNKSFFYPGANVSLVLSDAIPYLKENKKYLSFLKLSAAYSKTGNTGALPTYAGAVYSQPAGFPFGNLPGYTAGNATYDPNIKPEFVTSLDFGVQLGFMKDKIGVEVNYFNQDNTDQIVPVAVSGATGYTSSFVNAASFTNKGFEFDLKLNDLIKIGEVKVNFNGNATYNESKVTKIAPGLDELFIGGFTSGGNYAISGQPAFVFKANDYKRDAQGRVIVNDVSGRPSNDAQLKQFGRTMPVWTVGLTPTVQWKNIRFSATGEYKGGHYAYHQIGQAMAWTGVSASTAVNNRERFVFPNSVLASTGKPNTNVTVNDVNDFFTTEYIAANANFITSAASWRIREVSLGYNFPFSVLAKQKTLKGLSVTFSARNLALWVPKTNEYNDPDFSFTTGNTSGVQTEQINPATRILGINVTATF